ncbi:MAG TPA: hypothetical protein VGX51_11890 [Solirubrobacteraceae bacterium]|nr:hypothetical protein [Solirubrobacteraceae bacterium]
MRRATLLAALALLFVLDLSIVPLALAIVLPGGKSGHGPAVLPVSLYFLLVVSVLGWLTAVVVAELRKPTQ